MHPVVSIIVPSWHSASTLPEALRSCAEQDIAHEVIVVDGGSDDGTASVVASFGDHITVFISEPDSGVYHAINKGIDLARGTWIYILGADDVLAAPDTLTRWLSHASPEDRLLAGVIENTGIVHRAVPVHHRSYLGFGTWWKNTLHQQGALYHRSLFDQFRFVQDYKVLADYDFHLYLLSNGVHARETDLLVARCAAQGLSKRFGIGLYREEWRMKRRRLPVIMWPFQAIVIGAKYVYKLLTGL